VRGSDTKLIGGNDATESPIHISLEDKLTLKLHHSEKQSLITSIAGWHLIANAEIGTAYGLVPAQFPVGVNIHIVGPPPTIESCDDSGATKNEFNPGDDVYVVGSGYASSLSYVLKIVSDVDWSDGMKIPGYIVKITVSSDSSGNIAPTRVWSGATPGKYDIIVDVNGNDEYDEGIDALDDFDVETAGFFVIPEYWLGTILGLTGFFAAFGTYYMSKRRRIYY